MAELHFDNWRAHDLQNKIESLESENDRLRKDIVELNNEIKELTERLRGGRK